MTFYLLCIASNVCLAIPQGKIYSVDEESYNRPTQLLILLVPIAVIIGVIFIFKYLTHYKDAAANGVAEIFSVAFGTLANGVISFLKVMLFGLGLFALIMSFVFLSKFVPFSNFGMIGEKIMIALFAILAFGGPSIYKYITRKSSPQKQIRERSSVSKQERVIDTDEGVVDLGLSVLWTDISFPYNLTYRDVKISNLSSNSFRFTTKEELDELITKCKWQKKYIDKEHFGYEVIGSNGKSIFLQSSYKNEEKAERNLTTYPLIISIYFTDKGETYLWESSDFVSFPIPYIRTIPIMLSANSYIGKVLVKAK